MKRLVFIILSQFLSGSIWFAANVAYAGQGLILSAVQLGFIAGSLGFAAFNISDRFSPVRVFFVSAVFGAIFNLAGALTGDHLPMLMMTRCCCGICLAGIYPVGMKIAASWFPDTISRALGFLVGALVLASGFPWLIRALDFRADPWLILGVTSGACLVGGIIQVSLVGDGPHLPKASRFDIRVLGRMFSHPGFRGAAFGYFGHMWELYAVFAHVPVLFGLLVQKAPELPGNAAIWTFGFFVSGFLGCSLGGLLALKTGSRKVARAALALSGTICLMTPWIQDIPPFAALFLLLVWGAAVVADSPQFSALNTRFAPKAYVGSALTLVNCIGFLITIATIELTGVWISCLGPAFAFLPLGLGPVFGFFALTPGQSKAA